MKEKFLLDECIPIHWPNSIRYLNGDYITSVGIIGASAKDKEVLKLAKRTKCALVTSDVRLTLWAILENHPVLFQKMNGERYFIKAISKRLTKVDIIDPLTKFLSEKGRIIIP